MFQLPLLNILRGGRRSADGVEVRAVRTRRDLERFIDVPWQIYAKDPNWVPPLRIEVREFLDRKKHPFYRHGDAALFLAMRGRRAVGRILAADDPNFNAAHRANLGTFGMFESADDRAVAHPLLDAAAAWLRARGRTAVRGPIDYSLNYPSGLLVEGFQTPPRVMMNHNPPYYAGLLESWGLEKVKDLYCWWLAWPGVLQEWLDRAERLLRRSSAVVRPFRLDHFETDLERCLKIYNDMRGSVWGFVRLTEAEFRYLAKRISRIAVPEQVLLAEAEGRAIGFSVTLPDVNEAIRPLNGRLTRFGLPIGLLRLMWRMRRVKTARMLVLGLVEGYRRRGIGEMLILKTFQYGSDVIGYTGAELSWTMEDNTAVNHTIEGVGGQRYKTYRIFEKPIA